MKKEDILSSCTGFEWDIHNTEKIRVKHHVAPVECEQAFFNLPLIVGGDEKHSQYENHFYTLGQTDAGRLLFLVFTIRRNKLRIISARDMNRKEKRIYKSS